MQRKNYVTVLFGIVALVAFVASGCLGPEIPTGTYDQQPGGFIQSLTTIGGIITGTLTPPDSWCEGDVDYAIIGQLMEDPDPLLGQASIMYMATLPEGANCGWMPAAMCFGLEDSSAGQDGSTLAGAWVNCVDPENPGSPNPVALTLIVE